MSIPHSPLDRSANQARRPDPEAPFFVILNAGSGRDDAYHVKDRIESIMQAANRRCEVVLLDNPAELGTIARETVVKAVQAEGVVVAAGGDGAINAVVQAVMAALSRGEFCFLGILPQGTFNYFARTHHIPEVLEEALQVLIASHVRPVQAGLVNDKAFLVNASLGLYPDLLENREVFKQRYGRSRIVAFIAGFLKLMGRHRSLRIALQTGQGEQKLRTPTLFVGNNRLQLEQLGMPLADAPDRGALTAITLPPTSRWTMLWLILRGALGRLGDADNILSFSFTEMTVRQPGFRRRVKIATDGEIIWMKPPLHFRVAPHPLYLIVPEQLIDSDEPAPAANLSSPLGI